MSDFQSIEDRISHRRSSGNRLCATKINHNCDMKTFADRVRSARKAARLTQKQLGAASGLSQTTISDIERGRNETSADVVSLARVLGVLAEWLAEGRGYRTLAEATGHPSPDPTVVAAEPANSYNGDNPSVEARSIALARDAQELATAWLALPEKRRKTLLEMIKSEAAKASEPTAQLDLKAQGRHRLTTDPYAQNQTAERKLDKA